MLYRTRWVSAIFFALALLSGAALAQTEPSYKELPNFHKVNDNFYRGGQPRSGGIKKLAELGIKTIINLRGEDSRTRAEEAEAKAAGLRYFSVAMPGLGRLDHKQVARAIQIIDSPENWPVFVHCRRGSDRTGTVVACYHILHDGWTDERANVEAKRFGMSWAQYWMKDYVSDYYRSFIAQGRSTAPKNSDDAKASAAACDQESAFIPADEEDMGDMIGHGVAALEQAASKSQKAISWFFKKAVGAN